MTCPACHDTGYEAVDVDEVAPCTHPDHTASAIARQFAADPRFAHLNWSPEDWQRCLDHEEQAKNDSAHRRRWAV